MKYPILSAVLGATLSVLAFQPAFAENQDPERIPLKDVKRFSDAIRHVKSYYVKPVENKKLFNNAIHGMLNGLDPHSAYLDEESFKALQTSTRGKFGGLGIEVTMEDGLVKVITPLDDTPAAKAGLKSGDLILRLGQTPVKGLTLKQAVKIMRGERGSAIKLTVYRKGEKKPLVFNLVREQIRLQSVKSKMLDKKDGFGYVRVSHFQSLTHQDMLKAIKRLKESAGGKLKGLVLDLRNNPGGLLDSAINISDAFISNNNKGKEPMIVYTQGRLEGSKFTAYASPGDVLNNAPIIVLINGGSASGSEIVAGALKDNNRAVLLGTKSFGKGSVQTVLPLDEKSGIKLTTALYYTPNGTSIQAKGINPDIVVEAIKLPKKDDEKLNLSLNSLSEADLKGHLANGNDKKSKAQKAADKKSSLMHDDYQLYQALTLLKGMSIARK